MYLVYNEYIMGTSKKRKGKQMVQMTLKLDKDLHDAAKKRAVQQDLPLSVAMRQLLRGWVKGKHQLVFNDDENED